MLPSSSPPMDRPGNRRLSRIMSSASTMDSRGSLRLDCPNNRASRRSAFGRATEGPRYTMKRGPDWSAVNKRASKTAYDGLARALARLNGGPDPADWGRSSRSTTAGILPKMIKDNGGTLRETIENEVHMSLLDRQAILMWMLESLDALNVDDAVLFTAISIADRYGSRLARRSRYYAASAPLFLCGADLQQAIVAALCIALKTADTFDGKDALEKGVTVGDFLAHLCGYMLPAEQIYTVEAAILNELNFDVYSQTAEYVIRSVFSAHCPNLPAEPLPREYWLAQYLMEVLALSKPLAVLNTQASLAAVCIACEVCGAYSPVLAPHDFNHLRRGILAVWQSRIRNLGNALTEAIDKKYASPKRRCVSLISLQYYFEEASYYCS